MKVVLLKDWTVGDVENGIIGDNVTVQFLDENGLQVEKTGVIEEILID